MQEIFSESYSRGTIAWGLNQFFRGSVELFHLNSMTLKWGRSQTRWVQCCFHTANLINYNSIWVPFRLHCGESVGEMRALNCLDRGFIFFIKKWPVQHLWKRFLTIWHLFLCRSNRWESFKAVSAWANWQIAFHSTDSSRKIAGK